ncbi:MAG: DUF1761 domain-containing protein [Proteobacteria bacterium]|nr:DUF1761 domain-containing protein [Pseudomonadota bacterium]
MHFFAGLNPWIVLAAAAASFVFGGVWYGALAHQWMDAIQLTEAELKARGPSPIPFVITLAAQILMAAMLAGLILHLSRGGIPATPKNGLITGFCIFLGFNGPAMVVNHQFQQQKFTLTLIDCGHWLGVLLIQGAILGMWGLAA